MDMLDSWEVVTPDPSAVSFALGEEGLPPQPLMHWRMDLAADPAAAHAQLAARATQVAQMAAALETLPSQLATLAQTPAPSSEQVSFDIGTPPADQEFWLLVRAVQPSGANAEGVSFGFGESLLGPEVQQVIQQFQQEAAKILNLVSYLAWVETRVAGAVLGQTIIGWGSDARTSWDPTAPKQYLALHEQALTTALTSRYTLLRRLSLVLQGATLFSMMLSGQAWLAVPMLWQYVNRIVAEFQTPTSA